MCSVGGTTGRGVGGEEEGEGVVGQMCGGLARLEGSPRGMREGSRSHHGNRRAVQASQEGHGGDRGGRQGRKGRWKGRTHQGDGHMQTQHSKSGSGGHKGGRSTGGRGQG